VLEHQHGRNGGAGYKQQAQGQKGGYNAHKVPAGIIKGLCFTLPERKMELSILIYGITKALRQNGVPRFLGLFLVPVCGYDEVDVQGTPQ
jgi:hypothetical protein